MNSRGRIASGLDKAPISHDLELLTKVDVLQDWRLLCVATLFTHYLCTFTRKFKKQFAFILLFAARTGRSPADRPFLRIVRRRTCTLSDFPSRHRVDEPVNCPGMQPPIVVQSFHSTRQFSSTDRLAPAVEECVAVAVAPFHVHIRHACRRHATRAAVSRPWRVRVEACRWRILA